MSNSKDIISELINKYGEDELRRRLDILLESVDRDIRELSRTNENPRTQRSKKKVNAIDYVVDMDIPDNRKESMRSLAIMFDNKEFLPRIPDIKNFLYTQGVDGSFVRSRQSAITRLFFLLSSLSAESLRTIIEENAFSGPSRLEPLAEAIKRKGRANRKAEPPVEGSEFDRPETQLKVPREDGKPND